MCFILYVIFGVVAECIMRISGQHQLTTQRHGGTTEEGNCSYLLPLSHRERGLAGNGDRAELGSIDIVITLRNQVQGHNIGSVSVKTLWHGKTVHITGPLKWGIHSFAHRKAIQPIGVPAVIRFGTGTTCQTYRQQNPKRLLTLYTYCEFNSNSYEVPISNTGIIIIKLTHSGRVTHKCVCNLTNIGSENSLPPGRCQAITWTNAALLSNRSWR